MNYVVILPIPVDLCDYYNQTKILLIEKKKPEWIAGYYNLVGGKIEEGESPEQAAVRELKEESGLEPLQKNELPEAYKNRDPVKFVGTLDTSKGKVYCFNICVFYSSNLQQAEGEIEEVAWYDWHKLDKKKLFPNLRITIPLMLSNTYDWTIVDDKIGESFDQLELSVIFE